jgi:hypothetical protein
VTARDEDGTQEHDHECRQHDEHGRGDGFEAERDARSPERRGEIQEQGERDQARDV